MKISQLFHVKNISYLLLLGIICSCQTSKINIKSKAGEKPLDMTLLPIGDADGSGESLGTTPKEIELDRLKNKMLRVENDTGDFQYWFFPNTAGTENTIVLSVPKSAKTSEGGSTEVQGFNSAEKRNQMNRLLLKSYQALTGNKTSTALELAKQATTIDPNVAAPHIIIGLAMLRDKKTSEARAEFEKAKALDPADSDIDRLIESIK